MADFLAMHGGAIVLACTAPINLTNASTYVHASIKPAGKSACCNAPHLRAISSLPFRKLR